MSNPMDRVCSNGLLFDGAIGTMLISAGLGGGTPAERWILDRPEEISRVHRAYAQAGAEVVTTATFGGNAVKLKKAGLQDLADEINAKGAALARDAAGTDCLVAGNMGPTGELLSPSGTLRPEDAEACFAAQAKVLADGGVDFFLLQTFFDLNEILAAIRGVQWVSDLPIFASMTFRNTPRGFATVMGNGPSESMAALVDAGASVVGANCSLGSDAMVELAGEIRQAVDIPVMAKPNAGVPRVENGRTTYSETVETFTANMAKISALGVQVIGGCCGTTPEFIRRMAKR